MTRRTGGLSVEGLAEGIKALANVRAARRSSRPSPILRPRPCLMRCPPGSLPPVALWLPAPRAGESGFALLLQ